MERSSTMRAVARRGSAADPLEGVLKVTFTLNGTRTSVDVPGDTPVLWVLRDTLGLRGTKFGCGAALCGACTIHLNGAATRSCITPISQVQGARVTTIEGLSRDGTHALQRAWEELDVPQCGYCQAGQIMSAAALLAERPQPTDAEIDAAMSGNLCRCCTYLRIRAAIHKAAGTDRRGTSPTGRDSRDPGTRSGGAGSGG